MAEGAESLRVDKWLWHARFFKSRSLAAAAVEAGIRVDGTRVSKPSRTVSPGATLTFAQGRQVRVVRIVALGTRRGPAPEAQALYEDLTPPGPPRERPGDGAAGPLTEGARPTKRERRALDALRGGDSGKP
jgi:ribosome-associated heat shock protein Hsp15